MKRTREQVQREYGDDKWPAMERLIAAERAADPDAGFERIVGRVAASQWQAGDPLELRTFVVDGTVTKLPLAGSYGAAQGIVLNCLNEAFTPETDLIVELGAGWGWHILSCYARGGPAGARYVSAEYTEAGRRAASALAELAPELNFEAVPFDYHEPAFDLPRGRHAVVFTAHSIEQIPHVKPELFEALRGLADRVTCLHFEPVGWQVEGYSGEGSSKDYAEGHDYTRNLVPTLTDEAASGRLSIDLIATDVFGINPNNATTVIRWSAGG